MSKYIKQISSQEDNLYNIILLLSRKKLFYTRFNLIDTFQNRIDLIFIHISFIFIKMRKDNKDKVYKIFYQKVFDLIFDKIEVNMREIGFGDTTINKNMRFLVKTFYNILLDIEKYKIIDLSEKNKFFNKYLKQSELSKTLNIKGLIDYFNKYEAFCFDLSSDSVLKGDLNFNYK